MSTTDKPLRWGDSESSSEDERYFSPSILLNQHKDDDSDSSDDGGTPVSSRQQKDDYRSSRGANYGASFDDDRGGSGGRYGRQPKTFHGREQQNRKEQTRRSSASSSSGRRVDRKNENFIGGGRGGGRDGGNNSYSNNQSRGQKWKDMARTCQKYSVSPQVELDGTNWMAQRKLKQQQRQQEEQQRKEELLKQHGDELRSKHKSQIGALKGALVAQQEEQSRKVEMPVAKGDTFHNEYNDQATQSSMNDRVSNSSSPIHAPITKKSLSSSSLSMETRGRSSPPATRQRLKLAPRTKPIPQLDINPHFQNNQNHASTKAGGFSNDSSGKIASEKDTDANCPSRSKVLDPELVGKDDGIVRSSLSTSVADMKKKTILTRPKQVPIPEKPDKHDPMDGKKSLREDEDIENSNLSPLLTTSLQRRSQVELQKKDSLHTKDAKKVEKMMHTTELEHEQSCQDVTATIHDNTKIEGKGSYQDENNEGEEESINSAISYASEETSGAGSSMTGLSFDSERGKPGISRKNDNSSRGGRHKYRQKNRADRQGSSANKRASAPGRGRNERRSFPTAGGDKEKETSDVIMTGKPLAVTSNDGSISYHVTLKESKKYHKKNANKKIEKRKIPKQNTKGELLPNGTVRLSRSKHDSIRKNRSHINSRSDGGRGRGDSRKNVERVVSDDRRTPSAERNGDKVYNFTRDDSDSNKQRSSNFKGGRGSSQGLSRSNRGKHQGGRYGGRDRDRGNPPPKI